MNKKTLSKSFYAYVPTKSKTKTEIGPLIDLQNVQVEEEEKRYQILNNYFSSVFTLERPEGLMELANRLSKEKVASNLNKVLIQKKIVANKLCTLKSNKARGDDDMGSLILKERLAGILRRVQWRSAALCDVL